MISVILYFIISVFYFQSGHIRKCFFRVFPLGLFSPQIRALLPTELMAPNLQRLRLGDDEQHFGRMEAFLLFPIYEQFFAHNQELYFKLMAFMADDWMEDDD